MPFCISGGSKPPLLQLLGSMLRSASESTQIIASTQSVTLANEFEPENVIVVEHRDNNSQFRRLDPKAFDSWLVDMRDKVSLDRIGNELKRLIPAFDYVTTFYDYYGFHECPEGEVESIEHSILELVDPEQRRLLISYVQLYEFEALVLVALDQAERMLGVAGLAYQLRDSNWPEPNPSSLPGLIFQQEIP